MIVKSEISLENFEAWSGGKDTLQKLIEKDKCAELENLLDDMYPDGLTDTELNDLLWFDSDTVFEWVGIRTYDQILEDLEETKQELAYKKQEYEDEKETVKESAEEENLTAEEIEKELADLYIADYKDDIEELESTISDLESELADA